MNREERRLIRHLASLKAELQELQLPRPALPPEEEENAETNLNTRPSLRRRSPLGGPPADPGRPDTGAPPSPS